MNQKIYLAPMSGITDLAFRLISRKLGAKHCFYEMLDANAMLYKHPRNESLLKTLKDDSPISAQLVGADPDIMLRAAEKLNAKLEFEPDDTLHLNDYHFYSTLSNDLIEV